MSQTAKVFLNGRSQAVRLPASFRFDSNEVFIRRDPLTGDVILSSKPESWEGFLSLVQDTEVPDDFLGGDERYHAEAGARDPLAGIEE
ncbi:AbrB/MazE/SpoVT family DNA-binding domain-containing protein [Pseudomonas sp. KFB-139]|uniref:AbrB/MazE/SpoVT family DNA-binding domain-containing protein n=1 Tax=Pseudomonas serbiensis TaxID=3064350 RepID=A0ABT9CQJ5_9PSED|nr:AbrB/MazE/SpoVT family DNA-binding domain-containing protein [Pseudomonas sp. KFB-138]MDO7927762.1 AbrB/MazE/SpoVT family DNA-binding domain-containing protein [Pseudomonas sp. KFB-138]